MTANAFRKRFLTRTAAAAVLLPGLVMAAASASQTGAANQDSAKQDTTASRLTDLPRRQEQDALNFAKTHHPELARLLQQLRNAESVEYGRAIRELHQSAGRINRWKERAPQRFEQELEAWKLESEIRLLVARWSMSQDPELEAKIRRLLQARQQNRIDRLEEEQQRLQERLSNVSQQLKTVQSQSDTYVDTEWDRLTKRATAAQKASRSRTPVPSK